ncbi:aspartyl protease family protein 2-like [Cryptomeria japonica]|uniref:aspartyl protease family protein 2-like n=1 Tax=Cryptomeria japonica TaxID=3369 RepID=UPI0027DA37D0|nr:aspartyl protease family protein 2-like [Cryptomeria japonica]
MAMNKQARLFALCFFLYCILCSPSCECSSPEEKYYIVGVNTFLIEEGRDFNAPSRSPSKPPVQVGGLGRDKYLANRIFSHVPNSTNLTSSPLETNAFSAPVSSRSEMQGPEYTVTVSIGTPALEQLMGIDTLSSLSWIQCKPCKGCTSNAKCTFTDTNSLARGSEGDYITDTLQVGENTFEEVYIGCAYSFTQSRKLATSGRSGLGRGPLSLVSQKADGQFSYCLPNYLSARATGSLNLGKDSIPSSVKVYTPIQKEPKFASSAYILGLEGISVGGQRLSVNMQVPGALPTITYIHTVVMATQLVKPLYNALRASFEEKMKTYAPAVKPASPFGDFQPCYQLSNITSVKIPIVTLHFKGNANFDVPAVGTLLQVSSDVVCFPFSPSPNDAVNVIGDVQQQGITVAFDNLNNRIGFGSGSC